MTQADIEAKIKEKFSGLTDANITTLAHYLYKYPTKWRSADEFFVDDVNKLVPDALAANMRPSNALMGAMIAVFVIMLLALLWWVFTVFLKKNNKNVLADPNIVNPAFI